MLKTALKPKWVATLLIAIAVVAGFVMIGRWQLKSAFSSATTAADESAYRTRVPLAELATPGNGLVEESAARPASVTGSLVPGDYQIVAGRIQDGHSGVWVVGHLAVQDDGERSYTDAPGVPIALGWAADDAAAQQAIEELDARPVTSMELEVKVEAGQSPESARHEDDPQRILSMAPGQLINQWHTHASSYYSTWLLLEGGMTLPAGLDTIHAVAIDTSTQIDLLNIFYAIEWMVFAVMAIYLWFRMVRDDYLADQHARSDDVIAAQVRRELLLELARDRAAASPSVTDPSNQEHQ